jgi:uncharacterized protein (DUF2336 family)
VLVRRGDRNVAHSLAQNSGARFSEKGYAALVKKAELDDGLTEKLGQRLDVPVQLLKQLLSRATETVRERLLASAPAEARTQIQFTLASIAEQVAQEVNRPRDFAKAANVVQEINRNGKLNEAVVFEFADQHRYEEIVSALALLCGAPIPIVEGLMKNLRPDGVVVAGRAAGLKWPTVSTILKNRFAHHSISQSDLAAARTSFLALSQRTLRFWQTQEAAKQAV